MKKIFLLFLSLMAFMLSTSKSFAYLDPGTGSIILQAIIGFIAASIATLTMYWNKFKNFFTRIFGKKDKKNK